MQLTPIARKAPAAVAVFAFGVLVACRGVPPATPETRAVQTDEPPGWHDFREMEWAMAGAVAQPGIETESFDGLEAVAREWFYFGIFPHVLDEVGVDEAGRIQVAEAISGEGSWSVRWFRVAETQNDWATQALDAALATGVDAGGWSWARDVRGGIDVAVKHRPDFDPALNVVLVHEGDVWELEGPESMPVDAIVAGIVGP